MNATKDLTAALGTIFNQVKSTTPIFSSWRSAPLRFLIFVSLVLLLPMLHPCVVLGQDTLTNGANQAATLVANTTNAYTFSAANGDTIALRMGAPGFRPQIDLYGPGGALLGANAGVNNFSLDAYVT